MNTPLSPALTALPLPTQRTIQRALALLEQHLRKPGESFTSPDAVRYWLLLQMAGLEREVFMALYLDNQHRLLAHEMLFTGGISHTEIHPREVVKSALRHNSAALIVAHCHPSGHAEPSHADRQITERLKKVLGMVDIRLLDHLVVGGMDIVSFAERGWL